MEPNHSCSLVISSKSSTLTIQSVSEHEYAYFQGIHFNEVSPQASIINYFVFCPILFMDWHMNYLLDDGMLSVASNAWLVFILVIRASMSKLNLDDAFEQKNEKVLTVDL